MPQGAGFGGDKRAGGNPNGRDPNKGGGGGKMGAGSSQRGIGANGSISAPGSGGIGSFHSGTTVGGMGTDPYGSGVGPAHNLSHNNQINVGKAYRDFVGMGDSTLDKIGNALASMFGADEIDPTNPNANPAKGPGAPSQTGRANWGFDPIQAAASVGGIASGFPTGTLYHGITSLLGHPVQINMGPDFFGGEGSYQNSGGIGSLGAGGSTSHPMDGHDQGNANSGQTGGIGSLAAYGSAASPGLAPVAASASAAPVVPRRGDDTPGAGPQPTPPGTMRYMSPEDYYHYGQTGGEFQFFNRPAPTPVGMAKGGRIKNAADLMARLGRNGDSVMAHMSPMEAKLLDAWQGGQSINPHTGQREYFKFGKVLKGLVKAAGAIAGGYVGGPVGAAIGGGLAAKLTGSSWESALGTGLLSGLGGYAAQQTGIGDSLGIGSLSSNANLLGQQTGDAASGGIGSMNLGKLLPIVGIGAGLAMGAGKPKSTASSQTSGGDPYSGPSWEDYDAPDRHQMAGPADYYDYGQGGGEYQFFDPVNPVPVLMERGGGVKGGGGGQADTIPAMLSENEHVVDAATIADLGDGNSDEGHRRMEKIKQTIRKRAGRKNIKGIPKKQRGIGSLMEKAA